MTSFEKYYAAQKQKHICIEDIKSIVGHCTAEKKVVSFDVFDTMVMRPSVQPKDIFYLLQKKARQRYGLDFCQMRLNAEEELDKANATLEDIWRYIAEKYKLSSGVMNSLMQMEIQLEIDISFARPEVRELYEYFVQQGIRVIAVSDMYLPSEVVAEILKKNGYQDIEQIYISCENNARKDSGELFDKVLEAEKIRESNGLIHIGDNFISDYKIPLNKGITAIYYPSVWAEATSEESWRNAVYGKSAFSDDPYTRILVSFSVVYQYLREKGNVKHRIETLSDFVDEFIAPVAVVVGLELCNDDKVREKYNAVNFAARDGYIPHLVYQELAPYISGLPGRYIYVSRIALGWCAYDSFADLLLKSATMKDYALGQFLKTYIHDETILSEAVGQLSDEDLIINLKENRALAVDVLKRIGPVIQPYFDTQKCLAKSYYGELFADAGERSLVFDCGYSGSVSDGLMKALDGHHYVDKYYLWQTKENKKRDGANKTNTKCLFASDFYDNGRVHIIYEQLFSRLSGICTGFTEENNCVTPVFEQCTFSEKMKHDMDVVRSECLNYTHLFIEVFSPYLEEFSFFGAEDIAFALRDSLKSEMGSALVRLLSNICFRDEDSPGKMVPLSETVYHASLRSGLNGTGFNDNANYIEEPMPLVPGEVPRIVVHLHLYNRYLYDEILIYLREFPLPFDLIVTVTDDTFGEVIKSIFTKDTISHLNKLIVITVENRGRDVAPWLLATKGYQLDYDMFCHVHGKESIHSGPGVGDRWRNYLFTNLLSPRAVLNITRIFKENDVIGCVFPKIVDVVSKGFSNFAPLEQTERKMIVELIGRDVDISTFFFSPGTMFWYRPCALWNLFNAGLEITDFPEEPLPIGGTLAHALERCPVIFSELNGYDSKMFTQYEQVESGKSNGPARHSAIRKYMSSERVKDKTKNLVYKVVPWEGARRFAKKVWLKAEKML